MLLGAFAFVAIVFVLLVRSEPVKVVQSHLVRDGGNVFVEGRLRNTGSDAGTIDVEVRYYAVNGIALGRDVLTLGPLRPGAEEEFRTPARPLASARTYTIYLNHGRNPYGN
jgi:hypothetical protein